MAMGVRWPAHRLENDKGEWQRSLKVSDSEGFVLGYDIGGTKVAVCVADSTGKILADERFPSGATSAYDTVLPGMVALGKRLVTEAGLQMSDIKACGVCAPGPLDIKNGLMMKSPNLEWDAVPIRDDLGNALGVPTFLDNDANAGVLAEWFFGSAKGLKDVIYLTMSTGVGGGVVTGGHLMQGSTGIAAELGHVILDPNGPICGCGMLGCLEAYCGGRNVALRVQAALRDRPDHALLKLPGVDGKIENVNYQVLREGYKREIPLAIEMWEEACMRLAQGIGIYMVTFNPELIVLGTLAYYSGDLLMEPVQRYLPRFAWPEFRNSCRLGITALGDKIGELAGISVALYGLYERGE